MNQAYGFKGRPVAGLYTYLVMGVPALVLGALFIFIGLNGSVCLVPGLVLLILGNYFALKAARRFAPGSVIVHSAGVSLFHGNRFHWSIPWAAIKSIGTRRNGDVYYDPIVGWWVDFTSVAHKFIFFNTDRGFFRLTAGDDVGPEKKLREAFRCLESFAAGNNIPVEDGLGWGYDDSRFRTRGPHELLAPGGILTVPANLDASGFENRWHKGRGMVPSWVGIGMPMIILAIGSIGLVWGMAANQFIWVSMGIVLLPIGLIIGFAAMVSSWRRISSLLFDGRELTIYRGSGRRTTLPWNNVGRCCLDTDTRQLMIYSNGAVWKGYFGKDVTMAICKRFTESTGLPAECWSSGFHVLGYGTRNIN